VIEFRRRGGDADDGPWLSDKLGGRRGADERDGDDSRCWVAFAAIRVTPKGMLWLDMTLFRGRSGFFVYTPVMFSGVMSLDPDHQEDGRHGGGFRGLLRVRWASHPGQGMGWLAQHYGWDPAALGRGWAAPGLVSSCWPSSGTFGREGDGRQKPGRSWRKCPPDRLTGC